jgi:hypothetical protein
MTDGVAAIDPGRADDADLYCYRHPDRATRISCGRCERPICTRCAMQGPVGFRCRQCGRLAHDPLTSIKPLQGLAGFGVAAGGAVVAALVASQIGFFSIFISFFAGGIIAEAVTRVIGLKHGPRIMAIVLGGIVLGTVVGYLLAYTVLFGGVIAALPEEVAAGLGWQLFLSNLVWLAISAGAASAGAYSRLR